MTTRSRLDTLIFLTSSRHTGRRFLSPHSSWLPLWPDITSTEEVLDHSTTPPRVSKHMSPLHSTRLLFDALADTLSPQIPPPPFVSRLKNMHRDVKRQLNEWILSKWVTSSYFVQRSRHTLVTDTSKHLSTKSRKRRPVQLQFRNSNKNDIRRVNREGKCSLVNDQRHSTTITHNHLPRAPHASSPYQLSHYVSDGTPKPFPRPFRWILITGQRNIGPLSKRLR